MLAVPRKVLLEKYEEAALWDEHPFFDEVGDPHDVLDNPKSLAPFPDQTNHVNLFNQSNGNDATLLHHLTSNTIHNSTFGGTCVSIEFICLFFVERGARKWYAKWINMVLLEARGFGLDFEA